jgi:hypothetical protein
MYGNGANGQGIDLQISLAVCTAAKPTPFPRPFFHAPSLSFYLP